MGQGTDRLAHPAGGGKRLAAAGSQRRLRGELLADCEKNSLSSTQRLKPCSYESTYCSAGSAAPPQTGVFPQPPRLESAPAQCVRIGWWNTTPTLRACLALYPNAA